MNEIKTIFGFIFRRVLHWAVLLILILYTYAKFYEHPYAGFRMDSNGEVILLFLENENESGLQLGDHILQVDSVRWQDFKSDLRMRLFGELVPGQVLSLLVDRDGREIQISWQIPTSTSAEFRDLLFSEGWLGYFFWIAGVFTLLALRPRDERWHLIIAFNYLTAIWLVVGSGVSIHHIWGSAILFRILIWLCVPVYLHLHWVYPNALGKLPKPVIWGVYLFAGLMAIVEGFRLLPSDLYLTGFLIAVGGSFIFLLLHLLQPRSRRALLFLLIIAILSLGPAVVGNTVAGFIGLQNSLIAEWVRGGGALLGLPLLPFAYLYSAYHRQLGKSEIRVNRFFSVYIFLIMMGAIEIPLVLWSVQPFDFSGRPIIAGVIISLLTVLAGVWGYPILQNLVEHRILGIPLPSKRLLETYSTHITTSDSILDLIRILQEEILPSLLIRQFVFLHLDYGKIKLLSLINVQEEHAPKEQDVPELQARFGNYLPPELGMSHPLDWIRLILPLKFGDRLIGIWLFGRRDPDDMYTQEEIPILKSLANQTAIALSNILQTRQIKEMYETNVFRHEQERLRMARDLHDSVLNEMAALVISGDAPVLSPKFQQAYEAVTERLREIVSDLRPPMLNFGLKLALEGIADNLMERNQNSVQVTATIIADGELRYSETVEVYLFRIVQEACQNALRYAHAKTIRITGTLSAGQIDITVEDNGIGFVSQVSLKLDEMLANRHFGMAGMLERANLIGAEIKIDSKPQAGARVNVKWKEKNSI